MSEHMGIPEQPSSSQEAYGRRYKEVCDLMLRINGKLYGEYHNGEPKDWADVGNLGHVREVLQDVAEFLQA